MIHNEKGYFRSLLYLTLVINAPMINVLIAQMNIVSWGKVIFVKYRQFLGTKINNKMTIVSFKVALEKY